MKKLLYAAIVLMLLMGFAGKGYCVLAKFDQSQNIGTFSDGWYNVWYENFNYPPFWTPTSPGWLGVDTCLLARWPADIAYRADGPGDGVDWVCLYTYDYTAGWTQSLWFYGAWLGSVQGSD